MISIKPIMLEGKRVRLEPMHSDHLEGLTRAGAFEELWKWTRTYAHTPESMKEYVQEAITDAVKGAALPFATIDKSTGSVIGSTRFANFDIANRHVEIGWTWITPEYQRTYVNSEAKYLMLCHAFDVWECARVELKTDVLNMKSRNAMLRMGATEEAALRKHVLAYNNRWRDTIYYSVLDTEWPEVKARLKGFIERGG